MTEPREIVDSVFGRLNYDPELRWYDAKALWMGRPLEVSFVIEDQEPASAVALAHTMWLQQEVWAQRIHASLLEELLPLKNETWLEEDEAPVDEREFLARIRPEGVTFFLDNGPKAMGSLEFFFDDGDLFCGHSLLVQADLDGSIKQVTLAG